MNSTLLRASLPAVTTTLLVLMAWTASAAASAPGEPMEQRRLTELVEGIRAAQPPIFANGGATVEARSARSSSSALHARPPGLRCSTVARARALPARLRSRYERVVTEEAGTLFMRETLELPAQRIEPEDYPSFRALAARVDESQVLEMRMAALPTP